jgi:inner membrane protein
MANKAIKGYFLAPRKGNQLERALCMALFIYAVWMPQSMAENSAE